MKRGRELFEHRRELLFTAFNDAAEKGAESPSSSSLADLCGYKYDLKSQAAGALTVPIRDLVQAGRIEILSTRAPRVVRICATGKQTTVPKPINYIPKKYSRMTSAEKGTQRSKRVGHTSTRAAKPTVVTHDDPKLLEAFRGLV